VRLTFVDAKWLAFLTGPHVSSKCRGISAIFPNRLVSRSPHAFKKQLLVGLASLGSNDRPIPVTAHQDR
jgi:hypothetical protein